MDLRTRLFSSAIDARGIARDHYLARDPMTSEVFVLHCWRGDGDAGTCRIELPEFLEEATVVQAKFRGLIGLLTEP